MNHNKLLWMKNSALSFAAVLILSIPFILYAGEDNLLQQLKTNSPEKLLASIAKFRDTTKVNLLNALAEDLMTSDREKSLRYSSHAITIAKSAGYDKGLARAYNNVASVYYNDNNFPLALDFFQKSARVREMLHDKKNVIPAYQNIGITFLRQDNYKDAFEYLQRSLKAAEELDDKKACVKSLNNMGMVLAKKGDYGQALDYFFKALKIARENGDKTGTALSYKNIGEVYEKQNKYREAISYQNKNLKLAMELGAKQDLKEVYSRLADSYKLQKDYGKAMEYYDLYNNIKDSLLTADRYQQVANMQMMYEKEKREKEINLLKNEKATQDLELAKRELLVKQQKISIIVLATVLILLFTTTFFLYKTYRQKQKDKLNEAILKQQQLQLRAVIEAQEKERKRIAEDLHDGMGQLLAGLKMVWSTLEKDMQKRDPEQQKNVSLFSRHLDEASSEIRNISHSMMPRALSISGLVPAVEDLLDKNLPIKNYLEVHGMETRLPQDVEVNLYRIIQELLSNIIKHSGATEVFVQLFRNKQQLVLVMEDNGTGFDFDQKQRSGKGMGLSNITSRVQVMNGSITVDKGPKKGTVVNIRIPLS